MMKHCAWNGGKKKTNRNYVSSLVYDLCCCWSILLSSVEYRIEVCCCSVAFSSRLFPSILLPIHFSVDVTVVVAERLLLLTFCLPLLLVGFFFCSIHIVLTGLIYVACFSFSYSLYAILPSHLFGLNWIRLLQTLLLQNNPGPKVHTFEGVSGSLSLLCILRAKGQLLPYFYDWIYE